LKVQLRFPSTVIGVPADDLAVVQPAVGVHDIEELHPADLLLAVTGPLLPGLVHVQQRTVRGRHAHQIARVVEQVPVALLAFPQSQIGPLAFAYVPGIEHDPANGRVRQQVAADRLEPDRRTVRSAQAEFDGARHAGFPVGAKQSPNRLHVGGVEVLQQAGAHQLGRRVADDAFGRVADVGDRAVGGEDGHQIGGVLDQRAEPLLACGQGRLSLNFFGVGALPLQGGLDGRTDAGQIALEQVIRGPRLHASHRGFLVHRTSHNEEGDTGHPLPGQGERGHAIEAGKRVVGEDQIGAELIQLAEKCVPAVDPAGEERYAGPLEFVFYELGVHGHVLEDQDPERIGRHEVPYIGAIALPSGGA
jgi:hypothetical protein